jgi:acetyl-CoA C-acetyltransferase
MFSFIVPAYAAKYGVAEEDVKRAMTHIAHKNHHNGSLNERAHFRSEVPEQVIASSRRVAGALGVYDCSGVSDGAAAAIVCRADDAHRYTSNPMYVHALSLAVGNAAGPGDPGYDYTTFPEVVASAERAYAMAGVTDPASQVRMAEVHDCFTPTEMVLMEDLGFSERGKGWRDVLDGRFDLGGALPVNPDGGLKSFGHPIGASGLRMMFELWLQFRGEAGERQVDSPRLGLTHNLGGQPGEAVSFVALFGSEPPA